MIIHKILNNNAVIIMEANKEQIVFGRGIGYKKKVGQTFNPEHVEKIFIIREDPIVFGFKQILDDIPHDVIDLAHDIIQIAKIKLDKQINESIFVSLPEHLYATLESFENGVVIQNVMIWDIKHFYPEEFNIGKIGLTMIEQRFGVILPMDEAGNIASHLIYASVNAPAIAGTKIIHDITNIVQVYFKMQFDEDSVYFYRFITHLKLFSDRVLNYKSENSGIDNELMELVQKKYHNAYQCSGVVRDFLNKTYGYSMSEEESMYLTIHIERVVTKAVKGVI